MRPIVQFTLKQTVLLNVVFIILMVAGAFCIFTIPVENMPMVEMGKVVVQTVYYGASADDVEQLVTMKIEDALDSMANIEYIQSSSYRNVSQVMVKFIDDTDYKSLYEELQLRVLNSRSELPQEAEDPVYYFVDTSLWKPVVLVHITGNMPQYSLKLYAEELKTKLMTVPNVRSVEIEGAFDTEFHVSVDPAMLRKYGITFQEVAAAVESENIKIPTGRFRKNDSQFVLDSGNRLDNQDEVLNVVVRRDGDGNFIRVRNLVTSARLSHRVPSIIHSVDGQSSLRLKVVKEEMGNAVDISEAVKAIASNFGEFHKKEGIGIVFTNDSTVEINESIQTLTGNLIMGMVLVTLVLWITLGFRNAMLTAIGIPFSFLCSIIIMKFSGVTLNTISLFAFVLVTGIIVDDAIVIIENIFRHLEMGKSRRIAVIDGTAEVMLPVLSSALTTVLAFIPMLIMSGSIGAFFSEIPKTVTYALIASLIEALFMLPIHFLDWGPRKAHHKAKPDEEEDPFKHLSTGFFSPIWKLYRWILERFLKYKLLTLFGISSLFLVCIAVLILSITGVMPIINIKFFPGNFHRYHVTITLPSGTSIEKTDSVVRDLSRYIMSLGENQAQSTAGSAGFYEDRDFERQPADHYGEIVVTLPDEKARKFPDNPENDPLKHLDYIRQKLSEYISEKYAGSIYKPVITLFEEADGPPAGKPVNIRVSAATMEEALKASDAIMTAMKARPELADMIDLEDNRPDFHSVVRYKPRQESVSEYNLLPGQVTVLVAGALNGQRVGKYRLTNEEVDLVVGLTKKDEEVTSGDAGLADPQDVLEVPMIEHSESPVRLRDLVDVQYVKEPGSRSRYKGKPSITITSNFKPGSNLSATRVQVVVYELFQTLKNEFPGVSISFGGEYESTSHSYASLTFAFFVAFLGIYMVLASQFNNYFQPVMVISAVPFALIGVVFGLFATNTPFTIGSFLAIVGLAGISVNDSLLIIDFINVLRKRGRSLHDAVIESCAARMRPVMITTITTMLGLIPMAIGIPTKSITWAPMATAFAAGLCSATFLTLLIVPVEYKLFEEIWGYFRRIGFRRLRRKVKHLKMRK